MKNKTSISCVLLVPSTVVYWYVPVYVHYKNILYLYRTSTTYDDDVVVSYYIMHVLLSYSRIRVRVRTRTIIHKCNIHSVFIGARAFTSKTDFSFLRLNQIKITSIFVSQLV